MVKKRKFNVSNNKIAATISYNYGVDYNENLGKFIEGDELIINQENLVMITDEEFSTLMKSLNNLNIEDKNKIYKDKNLNSKSVKRKKK
jgi:hypothetical protein